MAVATGTAILGAGLLGAGSAAYGASQQKKAAEAAAAAGQKAQVDIDKLNAQVVQQSLDNARRSMALEQELTPEVAALRRGSIESVLSSMGTDPYTQAVRQNLLTQFQSGQQTQVGDSALAQAARQRAAQELALGGNIPLDVANQIARTSAARAGSVTGNLGLGRDISARDLGLTSLDLLNQRLATASQLGAQEEANLLQRAQFSEAQRQANQQLGFGLASLGQTDYQKALAAAQLAQGIQQPQVGLDPSSVANVVAGNQNAAGQAATNAANIRAAQGQSYMNLGGNLLGTGLAAYANYKPTVTSGGYGPVGQNIFTPGA